MGASFSLDEDESESCISELCEKTGLKKAHKVFVDTQGGLSADNSESRRRPYSCGNDPMASFLLVLVHR